MHEQVPVASDGRLRTPPTSWWRRTAGRIGWALAGSLLTLIALYLFTQLHGIVERPWHEFVPANEFSRGEDPAIDTLAGYLELEERLFRELEEWNDSLEPSREALGRFNPASPTHPENFEVNLNRTFHLVAEEPRGGALLLHGLSDSPYSLLPLGRILHRQGYDVVGLRLPGHGTAPGALRHVDWRDWQAAVRLAARGVRERVGGEVPFVLAGYSNGAALSVDYALSALDDDTLPLPDRMVFLSPALAVTRLAALARFQRWISYLPGLDGLAWNSVLTEYDPYKYNSFALNAGEQIYRLTRHVERRLQALAHTGRMGEFPPVLAALSVVDATVPPISSMSRLYGRIEAPGSEIVLFDVNRSAQMEMFLSADGSKLIELLHGEEPFPFRVTLVSNADDESERIVARHRAAGSASWTVEPLELAWPSGVYSLSHVAIPFPPDDPIYGRLPQIAEPYPLGNVEPRGERGALSVPIPLLMRLRYNPFFSYLGQRVERFIDSERPAGTE